MATDPNSPKVYRAPQEPYSNKAVAAFIVGLLTVAGQYSAGDQEIQLTEEGFTTAGTILATILVYFISNRKRKGV